MSKTCLFNNVSGGCGSEFKFEHIIQEGLGGSLKSADIVCSRCNDVFSRELDQEIVDFFLPIRDVLSPLLSGSLKKKIRYVNTSNGERLRVRSGARYELKKLRKKYDDAGVLREIVAPLKENKNDLERIAGLTADSFERGFNKAEYVIYPSINKTLLRAVLLDLIEILRYAHLKRMLPDEKSDVVLEDLKKWIRCGIESLNFPPKHVPFAPISEILDSLFPASTFSHRLVIIHDHKSQKMVLSAQFYNTMPFVIFLNNSSFYPYSLSVLYEKVLFDNKGKQDTLITPKKTIIDIKDFEWRQFSVQTREAQAFAICKFWEEYFKQYGRALFELDLQSDDNLTSEINDIELIYGKPGSHETAVKTITQLFERRYLFSPCIDEIKYDALRISQSKLTSDREIEPITRPKLISIYRNCLKTINADYGYPKPVKPLPGK